MDMGNLKLFIKGDKELDMEIQNVSEEAKNIAVVQAFALFGVIPPQGPSDPVKEAIAIAATVVEEARTEAEPAIAYQEPPRPIYKPQYVHNDTTTDAEDMKQAVDYIPPNAPEWVHTGIKMKHGVPHYRCRYKCTKCTAQSNHYIPMGVSQVDCHKCQTSLVVTKAIRGASMIPDRFKNFYVAGNQLPVMDVTYSNQKEKLALLKKNNLLDNDYKGNI